MSQSAWLKNEMKFKIYLKILKNKFNLDIKFNRLVLVKGR